MRKSPFNITLMFILGLLLVGFAALRAPSVAAQSRAVLVLEIDAAVTPTMLSYFERGIAEAEATGATAVLIVLNTPGGDVNSTLDIVGRFRNADVPIIVYVAPAGAQAASAGSIITMAGHAAVMAPETVIGAAAVVGSGGEDLPETLALKATEDMQATVRNLTARRGEEVVALAESMIDEAVAVTAAEALEVGLIDAIATDREGALKALDGLEVQVGDEIVVLDLEGAALEPLPLTAVENALLLLSNPLVVGFLLALAVPAILIELQSPGGWVAGFIGVSCLILGLYGLGQLTANWLGLGFVVIAFVLLLLEVKSGTGALGIVGAITLVAGLLVLFNSPGTPEFNRISIPGAIAISVVTAGFFVAIATFAYRAQIRPAITGGEGLVGQIGQVRGELSPQGTVLVHGELWRAKAKRPVPPGSEVVIKSRDGFTLNVEPVDVPAEADGNM